MTVFELENHLYSLKNKLNSDRGIVFGDRPPFRPK